MASFILAKSTNKKNTPRNPKKNGAAFLWRCLLRGPPKGPHTDRTNIEESPVNISDTEGAIELADPRGGGSDTEKEPRHSMGTEVVIEA